jgi:hypothetical protein
LWVHELSGAHFGGQLEQCMASTARNVSDAATSF